MLITGLSIQDKLLIDQKTVLGIIYMADVILARRSSKYPDKKFLFEVITKKRTYYMMVIIVLSFSLNV